MFWRLAVGETYRWYLTQAKHPLKEKVVGRWWRWFSKPCVWIRYDGDLALRVTLRDYIQRTIFFSGYYEPCLVHWLQTELRSNDIFWDIGANIGAISLLAAKRCHHVVSFEPAPSVVGILKQHVL